MTAWEHLQIPQSVVSSGFNVENIQIVCVLAHKYSEAHNCTGFISQTAAEECDIRWVMQYDVVHYMLAPSHDS